MIELSAFLLWAARALIDKLASASRRAYFCHLSRRRD